MALETTWFILLALLWTAFFVLEGFDFGVGMLGPFLGHDDTERRVLRATIGPFWDGNEVWLVTAGAGMFAAFPDWYATMFSAYYLPLFTVVIALILRAISVEFRDQRSSTRWRYAWDWITAGSCLLVPLLLGTAFGGLLNGIPIDGDKEFSGSFADLIQPYALATGVTFTALCLLQGLMFLRLKTTGDLRLRSSALAGPTAWVVVALLAVHVIWTRLATGEGVIPNLGTWIAITAGVAAAWLARHDHDGLAFAASTATVAFTLLGFFAELHPNLMVSSTSSADNLTIADSSSAYTLTLMTVIAVVMVPVVAIYSAWGYWVFRQRISRSSVGAEPTGGTTA